MDVSSISRMKFQNMRMEMPQSNNAVSAGEAKVDEYVRRIRAGETGVLEGLPAVFRQSIEGKLSSDEESKPDTEERAVPPQYVGLPSEIVDMLWSETVFVDPKKTELERNRKRKAIEYLKSQEALVLKAAEEKDLGERAENTGGSTVSKESAFEDDFSRFSAKHGTTGGGEFTWYEYRNSRADQMKEAGTFEWGKERIYFDVSPGQFGQLRDLAMRIAGDEKIPVGFKHLDMEETRRTSPLSIDGNETWFVANFASREDAKRWYDTLVGMPEYASLRPGRSLDYQGIRIDRIAEYAPGFREARGSLERMIKAVPLPGGLYEYEAEDGKKRRLRAEDFDRMRQQYELLKGNLEEARRFWQKGASAGGS